MTAKPRFLKDLGYLVVPTVTEWLVAFKVYEACLCGDGSLVYPDNGDFLDSVEAAPLFLHGEVKWDGCSNWHFDEQDRVMLHQCSRGGLEGIGKLLVTCWDMAKELMPNFQGRQ